MTSWQRRARLIIAVSAIAFALLVASQFRRRTPPAQSATISKNDPQASVESTKGRSLRYNLDQEQVRIDYDRASQYADGSSRMLGVKVVTERAGGRTFTMTASEAKTGKNELDLELIGDVRVTVSDGMVMQTERATYTDRDGLVRSDGPVVFSRGRMSGSGVGMTYAKVTDVLTILDRVDVRIQPDERGKDRTTITSGTATFTRPEHIIQLDRGVKVVRDLETTESAAAVAHLSADEQQLDALDLRGNSRITGARNEPGMLKSLVGMDVDLKYAAGGQTLERAVLRDNATIDVVAERGQSSRKIEANTIDLTLAGDGSTPIAVVARQRVQLTVPAAKGEAERTINADAMDAKGNERQGLTGAQFTGAVRFEERGADISRSARSAVLDVQLGRGLSTIDEARFSKAVQFNDGGMTATAAAARYAVAKGALELSGSEPGALRPHVKNERLEVSAMRLDVNLDGPQVTAIDKVESTLRPAKEQPANTRTAKADPKVPSMLKGDQDVHVTAGKLFYDGRASNATYSQNAVLWQGETKIKGESITIDDKTGDLTATGGVTTNAMILQEGKDKKKERVLSKGAAKEFTYKESLRRATYAGDASLVDSEGDLKAATIHLFLKASGDEIDRVEADKGVVVTLVEKHRTATGDELKYFGEDERYEMKGQPVTIVDECGRKNTGLKLTFFRATDRILLDGNTRSLTQTKSDGSGCR